MLNLRAVEDIEHPNPADTHRLVKRPAKAPTDAGTPDVRGLQATGLTIEHLVTGAVQ